MIKCESINFFLKVVVKGINLWLAGTDVSTVPAVLWEGDWDILIRALSI